MDVTDRVASRYLTKVAALDSVTQAVLEALRKKPDRNLTDKALNLVLATLGGWTIEKVIDFVQKHWHKNGDWVAEESEDKVKALHAEAKSHEVSSLPPTASKAGLVFTMDVGPIVRSKYGQDWQFTCKRFESVAGFRYKSPDGKTCDYLPGSKFDREDSVRTGRKIVSRSYQLREWMIQDTPFTKQILATLNAEEYIPKSEQVKEGSGTCPACFGMFQTRVGSKSPIMVLHGYERPGWGSVHGRCLGTGWPPYEISKDGTVNFHGIVTEDLRGKQLYLRQLEDGTVKQIYTGTKEVTSSDPRWEIVRKDRMAQTQRGIENDNHTLETLNKYIREWKPKPLPLAGARR